MDAMSQGTQQPQQPLFVGIDVSKDSLDVALGESGAVTSFKNDDAGHAAIVKLLLPLSPAMVVVEATGGIERPLCAALLDAGLPVALVHPGRVRSFARGLGVLAKTDPIDARLLARFGRLAAPRLLEKRSAVATELQSLVVCRRQLTQTRAQQSNRLASTASRPARKALEKVVQTLDKQVASLDKQIRELVEADDDFRHFDGLMQGVPGVGPTLSATWRRNCPSSAPTTRAGSAPWPAWRRSTGTRAGTRDGGASAADAPPCGVACTWRRWRRSAATR